MYLDLYKRQCAPQCRPDAEERGESFERDARVNIRCLLVDRSTADVASVRLRHYPNCACTYLFSILLALICLKLHICDMAAVICPNCTLHPVPSPTIRSRPWRVNRRPFFTLLIEYE
ncbi:hypothetical protein Zmor_009161 [Zophobas morio]|uniref:Uncharacterized protein n=1 Tax=Zophobas morio TaxID=2755281 RepID=A0AA38MI44_9CUCU|nr:hypothetical protein Zmor_009146 [Zophobas morio]KAJ3657351.1 hypothetical protein Zmor_009161 [Zophobas morio]